MNSLVEQVVGRVALACVMATVACPECAQQPGEWCATWDELAGGMVARDGLVHPRRVEAYQVRVDAETGQRGGVHEASAAQIDAAAEGLV